MSRLNIAGLALLCCALLPSATQQRFPAWRGSTVLPQAEWLASPIVAVGEVVNIVPYGRQHVDHLPQPMSQSVHTLYWCQGEFRPVAVVKGDLRLPPKRYLWASGLAGCRLYPDSGDAMRFKTHVWFLREEGDFLRPTYDGGAHLFLGLLEVWDDSRRISAREQLGQLLLKPAANSDTLGDYARYFGDVADIACELLGATACVDHIRALATLGNPALQEAACGFLKGQFGASCPSHD